MGEAEFWLLGKASNPKETLTGWLGFMMPTNEEQL